MGNLTGKAFPALGNLTLPGWGGGKLNRNCQVSNRFFVGGGGGGEGGSAEVANSYIHVFGRDGRV